MNRHDIYLLQQLRGYPCLSILMPTHRTSPENRQDPIRLKRLMTEVGNRLSAEFSKRELEPLFVRLENLVTTIDFQYTLDGLALFVNQDVARAFQLPVPLQERIVVDETFATRDLVFALNRSPRYWVLALSEKPTRLFEGRRDTLTEIRAEGFPMTHEGPGGATQLPGGFGISKSAYEDDRHRQFFRQVDAALKCFTTHDPLLLVVVGVERWLAHFNEVTGHRDVVAATLAGSHDRTPAHELGKLVWPLVEASLANRRRQMLERLDKAVGAQQYASGVVDAWRLANEGRGDLLLVEEDFHYPARLDEASGQLLPADNAAEPGVTDDAVDEVIEAVLAKKGKVVFVENGQLTQHQRIALILRY